MLGKLKYPAVKYCKLAVIQIFFGAKAAFQTILKVGTEISLVNSFLVIIGSERYECGK